MYDERNQLQTKQQDTDLPMIKPTYIALTLTLLTVFSSFLTNPALAAENDELAIITAERDTLRTRLSNAIAYSKARGAKLQETEMQLSKSMSDRKVLADRLRRAIAVSKERGAKLEETDMQMSKSMSDRKVLADRLRRAIAVSKERGAKLEETDMQMSKSMSDRKLLADRLRRAIVVSKERGAKLGETDMQLSSSMSDRKVLADRLRRAIAVSKERGQNLAKANASVTLAEDNLSRAMAYSKSSTKSFEEQLAQSKQSSLANWVAQTGASLQARIGGLEGTQIIESYNDNTVKVQLGNNGLFDRAGTALSGSGKALLSEIAPQLMSQDASFTVTGHTDNIPVGQGGRYDSNEALSFARATSALQYLRELGIAKEQLSAAGHGADSPIANNDTEEGRQQNRRVEIVLRSN